LETAKIVAQKTGKKVIVDHRLIEWDYGKYEGLDRHHASVDGLPTFQDAKLNFAVRIGKTGESLFQLAHRVYAAIDDVKEKYNGQNVLIISHGGVCRMIETYHRDMSPLEFSSFFMGNCELKYWDTKHK